MANPLDALTLDDSADPRLQGIAIRPVQDAPDAAPSPNNPLMQAVAPEQPPQNDLQAAIAKLAEYIAQGAHSVNDTVGRFAQYDRRFTNDVLHLPQTIFNNPSKADEVGQRFLGGENWAARMAKSGATLPGDVLSGAEPMYDEDGNISPRVIERAQDLAGMAGGSALAERPGVATLGSGPVRPGDKMPSLVPAIKYKGNIIKGEVGDQHLGLAPKAAYDYVDQHHGGDVGYLDQVPGLKSGFIDDKGRFLTHEKAGEYAADFGLVAPEHNDLVRRGGLTSELLLSDTSKPGAAVAAAASSGPAPVFYSALEHATTNAAQDVMSPQQWLGPRTVRKYIDNNKQSKTFGKEIEEVKYGGVIGNTPGVTPAEIEHTGLADWLGKQKGKVRKEDVQAYLDEHKVELKDVTKKGVEGNADNLHSDDLADVAMERLEREFQQNNPRLDPEGEKYGTKLQEYLESEEGIERLNHYGDEITADSGDVGGTKYSGYQLPGGDNYREHLLTLPHRGTSPEQFAALQAAEREASSKADRYLDDMLAKYGGQGAQWQNQATMAERREFHNLQVRAYDAAEALSSAKEGRDPGSNYKSSHWDEPNVLAHVRTNDRTIDGKKALHIEEVQSDWHQQGRKQGYDRKLKPEDVTVKKVESQVPEGANPDNYPGYWESYGPNGDMVSRHRGNATEAQVREEALAADSATKRVPDAPFKTTWPELAMKRMIRHAAENGYDRISWTPGEAQAARYDLSKQVKLLSAQKTGDKYNVYIEGKDGQPLFRRGNGWSDHGQKTMTAEELEATVGKEPAKKIIEGKPNKDGWVDVKDDGLKVGGEGMREFYDKMLPKMVEKIGKAHGVKVKQTNLNRIIPDDQSGIGFTIKTHGGQTSGHFNTKAEAEEFLSKSPNFKDVVHYFDLPQSLKDHAMHRGFPLYMSGIPFPLTPVDHDPFKKKDKPDGK